jgi:exosortase/archaeosortase family protein
MLRIISLTYLGVWKPEWFHWVHWYLWDALIMLDVLVIFLLWLRRLPPPEPRAIVPP